MSGLIAASSIDGVREAADILAVAAEFTTLKRQGQEHVGLCPYPDHQEKTPSFHVNPEEHVYKCHGCGKGGDTFRLVMDLRGWEFVEAVEHLADRAGVTLEYEGGTEEERRAARERAEERAEALRANALAAAHYRETLLGGADAAARTRRRGGRAST